MCIGKTLVRLAVIAGVVGGVGLLAAQSPRARALMHQAKQSVSDKIDRVIDDPVALRAQLRELELKYPQRIASVRSDLAEVNAQIAELEHEVQVASKVVELAAADLEGLRPMLARAEAARIDNVAAVINIRYEGSTMSYDQALNKAAHAGNTIGAYQTRAEEAQRNIGFLNDQKIRLDEILAQLESEQADLQAQIWQLDGQIEMIARNDKLIDLIENRENAIARHERYEAESLDQVKNRMERIRNEQVQRLEALANRSKQRNYEDTASAMLQSEQVSKQILERTLRELPAATPRPIEITPESADDDGGKSGTVAMTPRVVID